MSFQSQQQQSDPMSLDNNENRSGIPSGVAICSPAIGNINVHNYNVGDDLGRMAIMAAAREKILKKNNQRIKKANEVTEARQNLMRPTPMSMLWITTRRAIQTGGVNADTSPFSVVFDAKKKKEICSDFHETILSMPIRCNNKTFYAMTDVIKIQNKAHWTWGVNGILKSPGYCTSIEIRNFKPWPFSFKRPVESTRKRVKHGYQRYSICYRRDATQPGGYVVLQWTLGSLGTLCFPQEDISTAEASENITEITRWLRWVCSAKLPNTTPVACYEFKTHAARHAQEKMWENNFMCI